MNPFSTRWDEPSAGKEKLVVCMDQIASICTFRDELFHTGLGSHWGKCSGSVKESEICEDNKKARISRECRKDFLKA